MVSQSMALFSIQAQVCVHLRDWSLITGRGEGYKTGKGGGGACEVLRKKF